MSSTDLLYKIAITLVNDVGDITAKRLISYCGGVEAVFKEKKTGLLKIPGIGQVVVRALENKTVFNRAEQEMKFIEKEKITPLFYLDKNYPKRLLHCEDSPVLLYTKGDADLNNQKVLGIVGTREATDYGKQITEKIAQGLSEYNVLIVSGLAYGVDIAAHKAALKNNLPTAGVLAHGLDRIYPSAHRSVAKSMCENGMLITECLSGTIPDRENFPKRNRIVAGMVDALLVVESGRKGGSLITAEIAHSYNRDVFAVPGKSGDEFSTGCNWLIKTNKATLVESYEDILFQTGWIEDKIKTTKKEIQRTLFVDLNEDEKVLVNILNTKEIIALDDLCLDAKIPVSKASSTLLNLEFKGIVKSLPGKSYRLT